MQSFEAGQALQAVLSACPLAIIGVDKDLKVRLWNPGAENILGWTQLEVIGKSLPATSEEEARKLLSSVEHGLHVDRPDPDTLHWSKRDGGTIDIRYWGMPWLGAQESRIGMVLAIADNTASRQAEVERVQLMTRQREAEARARAESRFRELLEAAPDAIIEVDRAGRIVLLNAATEKVFGYTREELLGQAVEMLIPADKRAMHRGHRAHYWERPLTRPMGAGLALLGERKDGARFPVEISLSPVLSEGDFRVTAIIRDVTERKNAEEEIKSANQQLELRNQEVERANRLKSEFLASMSHELRTPLHTIIGFAELLIEEIAGSLNEKQKRFLEHVHRDSQHLLELINDILDLSRIEAGRVNLRPEFFDPNGPLAEVLTSIRPAAAAKSIEIEGRVENVLTVYTDRLRFKEILYNLLSNAVKFTPEHGRIWIEASAEQDLIVFSVADTGIGIPGAEQDAIFDKFYQGSSTTKGVREGTGLGLAITKHLVEQQGGRIWVRSEPRKGSRFSFTISDGSRTRGASGNVS